MDLKRNIKKPLLLFNIWKFKGFSRIENVKAKPKILKLKNRIC